jgi:CBS domain-containing protein
MEKILVLDIMTRYPISVKPSTNLLECAKKMVKERVGGLLVAENKNLKGFITQRDILWALIKTSKENLSQIKAIDISSKKTATIKPESTIKETIEKMKKLRFERLPVVKNNEILGIVTSRDILLFDPKFYPELEELAKIKEEAQKLERFKKVKNQIEGVCEECGNRDFLHRFNGMLICESCNNSN